MSLTHTVHTVTLTELCTPLSTHPHHPIIVPSRVGGVNIGGVGVNGMGVGINQVGVPPGGNQNRLGPGISPSMIPGLALSGGGGGGGGGGIHESDFAIQNEDFPALPGQ